MSDIKLKIDIISDLVCPWCVIGVKHLRNAVVKNNWQHQIAVEWYPFELNPDMPAEGENLRDHIVRKYGISEQESDRNRQHLIECGKKVNFDFNFTDQSRIYNTRHCHVLLDYAYSLGLQTQLIIALVTGYFTDGKNISDIEVLLEIGESVGLEAAEMLAHLSDASENDKIDVIENQWIEMGISGVPTMVFNNETAITGAQSVEDYEKILRPFFETEE
ncbi:MULTISPECIES: DsbA family oxidoreductase [Vibrio]|uniref:DsbA family oxidoreductase n=1 Tax=Vibrio algicola TaxID=2662262 RepID=A0A5Q0TI37_9VIBR|nr:MULTISPECIES: DsbA family oxidoreductase [Vibrio]MBD1577537.1 DsbA family oxidoreductase [Vibrio sp. S11_S32]